MDKAFQYNTLHEEVGKDTEIFWEKLSKFGLDGWELVAVLQEGINPLQAKRVYFLKRQRNRSDLEEEQKER